MSEDWFRTSFERLPASVVITDAEGRFLQVNPAFCAFLGYPEEELLKLRLLDVTYSDDQAQVQRHFSEVLAGLRQTIDLEKRCLRKDGAIVGGHVTAVCIRDEDSHPIYCVAVVQDITERRRAEEALRASEERYRRFFERNLAGVFRSTLDGTILDCNESFARILGYASREEALAHRATDFYFQPADREAALGRLKEQKILASREVCVPRKDGSPVWVVGTASLVEGGEGVPAVIEGTFIDITERKQAEAALRESATRLQTLSHRLLEAQETERRSIARELHDEIGQALTSVKISLQTMQRLPELSVGAPYLEDNISIVELALEQVRDLSLDLRPSLLDDLGLAPALRWYLDRQAQRAGLAAQFVADPWETRLPADIETACFRVAQEAITNIMRHAQASQVQVELRRSGAELQLIIRDDGVGFDVRGAQARAVGGASFGLQGMEERVRLVAGQIEIESTPGRGTRIRAKFPL
ncbi:MAG: PAS domain S-box protein [Acidobacteria bacterium]|nr:PAS domain S-box protein [Acidobacteriota bacterium]